MTLSNGHTTLQNPQYFTSQSDKLSTLLDVVVAEANTSTDPEACVDYLELTDILIDLLEKSQLYSALPPDQVQSREQELDTFVSQLQTVQDAVGDWNVRTKPSVKDGLRKRTRSLDLSTEVAGAFKRPREDLREEELVAEAASNTLSEEAVASSESSGSAWWAEPFYD